MTTARNYNYFLATLVILVLLALLSFPHRVWAGVFNIPHFVPSGEFAFGIEPELTLSDGAGIAANVKTTYGLNDVMDAQAILGTGTEPRKFRIGGNLTFDFFPDIEGQPGIGVATQALYYRIQPKNQADTQGQLELTGIPYIHKTFRSGSGDIEPFLAVPLGIAFNEGRYKAIASLAIGSLFKSQAHFSYSMEFGININNTETYVSGGVIYSP